MQFCLKTIFLFPPTWAPVRLGSQQIRVLLVLVKAESTLRPGLPKAASESKFRWGIPGGSGSTLLFKTRDFESLDLLLPSQLNSPNQRSVTFLEFLLGEYLSPHEACFNPSCCGGSLRLREMRGLARGPTACPWGVVREPRAPDSARPPVAPVGP